MFALKSMSVCLLACFLSRSVSQASKQVKDVKPGATVTLHCQGPRDASIELVEWTKPDLKSDEYVFFFRDMQFNEDFQHPQFRGRVKLVDPEMKNGDFSVILKNVNIYDAGEYQCRIGKSHSGRSKRETPELINSVTMKVDPVHKHMTANTGDDVSLPCPTLSTSPITSVKWIMQNKKDYVFLNRNKRSVPDHQHPYYKDWVELEDGEMKDGDASLILKDVMNINSGRYECWIHHKGTNYKTSIIDLYVYPPDPHNN
ncbi:Junctional adhesion molecule-like [Channa argus]|uniref:Junctional adhesion molecule-like n=1 Tax=Channa argus TaxID=215402 RepID=A0A6G1Q850_CHAAH|nr:Junctional adhesion molecule-like [Channa argus]KAK2899382.1 hypothetical protein Q8A73_012511 [Channa argus]